jgi:hypothetical protein
MNDSSRVTRFFFILAGLLIGSLCRGGDSRPVLKLENELAEVVIDLGGGSIAAYRLKSDGLNPLQWDSWSFSPKANETPPMLPRPMGHFLCLDRWGSASDAEKAHGMANHGEATQVWWEGLPDLKSVERQVSVALAAKLPMAGISVERHARMQEGSAVVLVEENVANTNPIGRIYNIVQHPTIGPPFLDTKTIVDSNGTRGFMQERPMPEPEKPEVHWPMAKQMDGAEVNLRYLKDDPSPNVVSFIIEEEYGWVTATSPESGLLLGYLWKSSDYPWLNIWRHVKDGKPFARGLEFGTSGLHRPGSDLVAKGRIFDRTLYRYIDADEKQSFRYAMFLVEVPRNFDGVASLEYADSKIRVTESGPRVRKVNIEAFSLFGVD